MDGLMNNVAWMDRVLFHLANGAGTNPALDWLMPAVSRLGNAGAVWIAVLGLVAAFGKRSGRRIALAGLVALAVGFVCSTLIKDLTMRPRPFALLDHVRLLVAAPHFYALPSGHTTSAFAASSGAVLTAKRLLKRVPIWGWSMLALAAAVAYSRIYVRVHWPTDVAAGMVLGLACGWVGCEIALRTRRRKPPGSGPQKADEPEETAQVQYAS